MKTIIKQSFILLVIMSVVCGGLYTAVMWGVSQLAFSHQANGSTQTIDGKEYSTLLGQNFEDENHMWGRIVNIDISTYKDKEGNPLAYGYPSNLSPASDEYAELIKERVAKIESMHPEMKGTAIPVDLVTCSGSGLDSSISVAAANYQVKRLAKANDMSEKEVQDIIDKCTQEQLLGVFGETTVNVVAVNMMLEDITK